MKNRLAFQFSPPVTESGIADTKISEGGAAAFTEASSGDSKKQEKGRNKGRIQRKGGVWPVFLTKFVSTRAKRTNDQDKMMSSKQGGQNKRVCRIWLPELLDDDGGVGELAAGPVAPVHLLHLGGRAILAPAAGSVHRRGLEQGGVDVVQPGLRGRRLHLHLSRFKIVNRPLGGPAEQWSH